jgi:hypothetical protein
MPWADSRVFGSFLEQTYERSSTIDVDTDVVKAALFNNTGTPDRNATAANSILGVGAWVVGNQLTDTNWPAGGITLTSVASAFATGVYTFDAADTPSSGNVTITNAFGTLVYDDSVTTPNADPGISFNYFGGGASVTSGTFTIVWNASGIFTNTF